MNRRADTRTDTATELLDVLIIGAGFSGLGAAIQAQKQGCRRIAILEKGPDVGGVWREMLGRAQRVRCRRTSDGRLPTAPACG